jgi:hypothetical protein
MKIAKNLMLRLFGAVVLFFFCTGTGYVYRTYECRSDRVRVYVAAPGYEVDQGIPERLYAMHVTKCTLPQQWGGDLEPLEGYP